MTEAFDHVVELGPVQLSVRSIERARVLYESGLGLADLGNSDNVLQLGAFGRVVLELVEEPDARPADRSSAGLFHVAILYGSRIELARTAQRLIAGGMRIDGAADHGTHEALYLRDDDGNGLELAADRPRNQWPATRDNYARGPEPLDVAGLMGLVASQPVHGQVLEPVRVGHVHLHVGDIDRALEFYRDVVGFELQARRASAAFVSFGGYHHHLAVNVWNGVGVPPASPDVLGLRFWNLCLADSEAVVRLVERLDAAGIAHDSLDGAVRIHDPWRHELRIRSSRA